MMRFLSGPLTFRRVCTIAARLLALLCAVSFVSYYVGLFRFSANRKQLEVLRRQLNLAHNDEATGMASGLADGNEAAASYRQNNRDSLRSGSSCVFPGLDLKNPEIMKFYQKLPRVECDTERNWVELHRGKFLITSAAARAHPKITCDAYPIVKKSDFKVRELDPIKNVANGTELDNDFYRVECSAADHTKYNNYHAAIHHNKDVRERPKSPPGSNNGLGLDVIMLGLDSTSHMAWQRHLPKTRKYFMGALNGTELNGYNILGDGTPAAIMPILLGKREEELPEARRNYEGAKPVDNFPWIWNDFRKAGYATAWGEDDARLGTFQYRLLGFTNQPTDHYYRYFSLALEPHYGQFQPLCVGSRPRHAVLFDYMREMFYMYPDRRKWIFSFQSELSHKDNNLLSRMDDDIRDHLMRLEDEKFLDNAVLILMADHGGRFSKVRATAQGKQEERLPYFGIRFPKWFHEKHPDIIRNIEINKNRLTTPFDIHETFHDILNFTGAGKADISKRGVSLFKEIPIERDCANAQIDPHWCSCLDWVKVSLNSPEIVKVVAEVINTFNNFTEAYRGQCAALALKSLESASALKVKDEVLKFKDTNDGGRGRFGSMTDTTKHSKILYQITLFTTPGDGRFEVTVTHHLAQDRFQLDQHDISRTNKYGDDPHCVEKQDAFLRPYCYCKDRIKT